VKRVNEIYMDWFVILYIILVKQIGRRYIQFSIIVQIYTW
jgi:hypothetical protein